MKRLRIGVLPCVVVAVVLIEEALRHATAGSSIVAAILSSRTGDLTWQILVAVAFVGCRFLVLWLLPAIVVTRIVASVWRKRG